MKFSGPRTAALGLLSSALVLTSAVPARPQSPPEPLSPPLTIADIPPGISPRAARPSDTREKPAVFRIKYVTSETVYLAAGRNAGLEEGMKLSAVKAPPDGDISNGVRFRGQPHVAELQIISVADSSSVCAISSTSGELRVGEIAFLSVDSVSERRAAESAAETEQYPATIGFTYGDPLDDEVRETQEKRVIQESPVGRIRGGFGFDYGGTQESGGFTSRQVGMVINADMTFIGGSYWNFTGYWRGNLNSSNSSNPGTQPTTLNDLINRTYHLSFTYDNPYSPVKIGIGRLFLPWAPSLSTIDGAYLARRVSRKITVGAFAGSTPDPTSWSYNPDQHIAGSFVNYETGDFDHARFFSTAGIALTSIQWRVMRQFAFFENTFSWKRYLSFYSSLQADEARVSPLPNGGSNPTGISQSYSSMHIQPLDWLSFGVNHNYFRNLPTFDPRLVSTGLLDQYLFQGFSGDVRVQVLKRITLYSSLGRSSVSSDSKASLNQGYGISFVNLPRTGLNADFHYSKFNSSFGTGSYEAFSLSKSVTETFHVQFVAGQQVFNSPLSANNNSKFVNAVTDLNVGPRYFLEGNFGWYTGTTLSYRQWSTVFGYRFGGFRK
jgi:hypothetical protein